MGPRINNAGLRRIVVAPDKFKGSLSATDAAAALARGLRRQEGRYEVVEHPIADGGDGTVDVLLGSGFDPVTVLIAGPMGRMTQATYATRGQTAVIEAASAVGLALLEGIGPSDRTATMASTYGVGQLILDAVAQGAREIVVGLGGTVTTDGGAGALVALGARVLDSAGAPVVPGGLGLATARTLNLDGLVSALADVKVVLACDVDNPLTGSDGAAETYAPQKGASAAAVALLEGALQNWSHTVTRATGEDLSGQPGMGAAGGLAFGLASGLEARVVSGADLILELSGFRDVVAQAELLVVGEGSLDRQSLHGKGPVVAAAVARGLGVPVVAVVGRNLLTREEQQAAGLSAVYALSDIEPDEQRSVATAGVLLERTARRIAEDLRGSQV